MIFPVKFGEWKNRTTVVDLKVNERIKEIKERIVSIFLSSKKVLEEIVDFFQRELNNRKFDKKEDECDFLEILEEITKKIIKKLEFLVENETSSDEFETISKYQDNINLSTHELNFLHESIELSHYSTEGNCFSFENSKTLKELLPLSQNNDTKPRAACILAKFNPAVGFEHLKTHQNKLQNELNENLALFQKFSQDIYTENDKIDEKIQIFEKRKQKNNETQTHIQSSLNMMSLSAKNQDLSKMEEIESMIENFKEFNVRIETGDLFEELNKKEAEISKRETNFKEKEQEFLEIKQKNFEMHSNVKILAEENNQLSTRNQNLSLLVNDLTKQYSESQTKIGTLNAKILEITAEKDIINRNSNAEVKKTMEKFNNTINLMKSQINDKQIDIMKLKRELKTANIEVNLKKYEIDQINQTLKKNSSVPEKNEPNSDEDSPSKSTADAPSALTQSISMRNQMLFVDTSSSKPTETQENPETSSEKEQKSNFSTPKGKAIPIPSRMLLSKENSNFEPNSAPSKFAQQNFPSNSIIQIPNNGIRFNLIPKPLVRIVSLTNQKAESAENKDVRISLEKFNYDKRFGNTTTIKITDSFNHQDSVSKTILSKENWKDKADCFLVWGAGKFPVWLGDFLSEQNVCFCFFFLVLVLELNDLF